MYIGQFGLDAGELGARSRWSECHSAPGLLSWIGLCGSVVLDLEERGARLYLFVEDGGAPCS